MKKKHYLLFSTAALLLMSCNGKKNQNGDVVSERYIHKYGYDVSKEEWQANQYPGQVVTALKNGVTIAASYEDGVLHGQTTYTYPHSQTLESLNIFERGNLIKKVTYDLRGMPLREDTYYSPTHIKSKYWYSSGTPMAVEEVSLGTLIEGEYYTVKNELESRVSNGAGVKTSRDKNGLLLVKEVFDRGHVVQRETFFANGTPHVLVHFQDGKLHGEKRVFAETGEPLSVENFDNSKLDGLCTYYQNGTKFLEITYRDGSKDGFERHFIDGETLSQETEWHDNTKHGPSIFYSDGISKTEWFYNNELVSKLKYDELLERERIISVMNERAKPKLHFDLNDD